MKLRTRLLLTIGLTMVCLFVGISQLSENLIMKSFTALERSDTERNIERVRRTVEQMNAELHIKNADWSKWDETYQFMGDRNVDYLKSNVNVAAVSTLELNLMLFVSKDFQVAAMESVQDKEAPAVRPQEIIKALRSKLDTPEGFKRGVDGLILHQDFPMLVSALPVFKSDGTGERRGWVVFGSYMDARRVARLQKTTRLDAKAYPATATRENPHGEHGPKTNSGGTDSHVVPISQDEIAAYTYMNDIAGNPALLLRLKEPRAIFQQGQETVKLVDETILVVGLIFCLVIAFVLEKFALARLWSLTKQVEQIGDHQGAPTVTIRGRDELSNLAARINEMLSGIAEEKERVLEQKQEVAAKNAVLESAIEGIGQLDVEGRYVAVNSAFARMLYSSSEDMIGQHWSVGIGVGDHPHVQAALRHSLIEGRAEVLVKGVQTDGTQFFEEVTLIPSLDHSGQPNGHHIFAKDVTERKVLEMQIEHQAFHDKLTDLPNRALFMDRIKLALAKAQRHGLGTAALFIDLDNFKLVNDSLGHDAGDALLIEVSNRLRDCVRPGDTVARLGGDEFTILLEDLASSDEAEVIARRVLDSFRAPINLEGVEVFASASIGVAFANDPDMDADRLMKNADTTMYYAKARGKSDYVLYEDSMQDSVSERMELETALRKGLDTGEIFVQYQPLVDLSSGLVIGAEALARWMHPTRGLVPPVQFIPIAEETGLILPLGYKILEEACWQARAWQIEFDRPDLTISVNLSGRQLQQNDVVDRVAEILERTGLSAASLKLEITESVLMERTDCLSKLNRLKELGLKLALDDFGTGYSSLAHLSAFPIDTIKIDRAFISRLDQEDHSKAVVQAIMALSRSMNMNVTSEGVETASQMSIVKSMGCEVGQGYLFAKPLDACDFGRTLLPGDNFDAMAA
jgi:diguanylate cyclase (GGDEF)-like protein/PAS domain S-box-containing protein